MEVLNVDGSKRGQFCPFDEDRFCAEEDCRECEVRIEATACANEEMTWKS